MAILQSFRRYDAQRQGVEGYGEVIGIGGGPHVHVVAPVMMTVTVMGTNLQEPLHLHHFAGVLRRQDRDLDGYVVARLHVSIVRPPQQLAGIDYGDARALVSHRRNGRLRRLVVNEHRYSGARGHCVIERRVVEQAVHIVVEHDMAC